METFVRLAKKYKILRRIEYRDYKIKIWAMWHMNQKKIIDEEELAKKNQGTRIDLTFLSNDKKVEPFHSGKVIVKEIGISSVTFKRDKKKKQRY